ncbi:MAG: P-II family nitrogen regulator [Methanothrix sp.]|nr:P-II family nitrogen regulator [Methanothrix sp.]
MKCETDLSLIITIVKKGWGDEVLCASMDAGAEGGTILFGRGFGVHEYKKLFNIMIEPEKEVVLTVVSNSEADRVLESIVGAGKLEESGKGIVFLISIDKLLGRAHRAVEADPPAVEEGPVKEESVEEEPLVGEVPQEEPVSEAETEGRTPT